MHMSDGSLEDIPSDADDIEYLSGYRGVTLDIHRILEGTPYRPSVDDGDEDDDEENDNEHEDDLGGEEIIDTDPDNVALSMVGEAIREDEDVQSGIYDTPTNTDNNNLSRRTFISFLDNLHTIGDSESEDSDLFSLDAGLRGPRTNQTERELSGRETIDRFARLYDEKVVLKDQPASIYSEPLNVKFLGTQILYLQELPQFRNNLAAVSQHHGLMFLAENTFVRMYKIDVPSKILEPKCIGMFDTRPEETTPTMRAGANWTEHPHGINFIKTGLMGGKEYLVTASDDGRAQLFKVSSLLQDYRRFVRLFKNRPWGERRTVSAILDPITTFQLPASAWGISFHDRLQLLAVSCNSAIVKIFDLKGFLEKTSIEIPCITSPTVQHNIPDISFIDPAPEDVEKGLYRDGAFYLYCISIKGDVILWEFLTGKLFEEFNAITKGRQMTDIVFPLLEDELELEPLLLPGEEKDPVFLRIPFKQGRWMTYRAIEEECWTINTIDENDFKEVESFYELSGNAWLNENNVFRQLSTPLHSKYAIPGLNRDSSNQVIPLNQAFIDFAMRFTHYSLLTTALRTFGREPGTRDHNTAGNNQSPMQSDQNRHKMNQAYINGRNKNTGNTEPDFNQRLLKNPPLNNRFIVVTGKKSLYLCRAENLLCRTSTSDVFRRGEYIALEAIFYDRINMVKVIPGLSAIVVASQLGAVSVFRLVRYKSLFTLRQEYLFPVQENLIHPVPPCPIAGLTVTPVYESNQVPGKTDPHAITTHRLTVVYKMGLVLTYDLSRPSKGDTLGELIF